MTGRDLHYWLVAISGCCVFGIAHLYMVPRLGIQRFSLSRLGVLCSCRSEASISSARPRNLNTSFRTARRIAQRPANSGLPGTTRWALPRGSDVASDCGFQRRLNW